MKSGVYWLETLISGSLYDKPVCLTFRLKSGDLVTQTVIIKDIYADHDGQYLVIANGSLINFLDIVEFDQPGKLKRPDSFKLSEIQTTTK